MFDLKLKADVNDVPVPLPGRAIVFLDADGQLRARLHDGSVVVLLKGDPGAPGADGAMGPQGPQGVPGADGADGAPGADGVDGAPGADGADGAPGADGADGAPGADGAMGPQGVPGADGKDGAPGADGVDGAPGADGKDGAPGVDGAMGPQGPQGLPGADGVGSVDGWVTDGVGQLAVLTRGVGAFVRGQVITSTGTNLKTNDQITAGGAFVTTLIPAGQQWLIVGLISTLIVIGKRVS